MPESVTSTLFSLRRFAYLFRAELTARLRTGLLAAGAILGVLFLGILYACYLRSFQPMYFTLVYQSLFALLGVILTGQSFRDYYRRQECPFLLTLPASVVEKWLARFLLTTVGWIVLSFAAYTVFVLLVSLLALLFFKLPLDPRWWNYAVPDFTLPALYGQYLLVHGIFFLGSVVFRKAALVKTVFSLCGLALLLAGLAVGTAYTTLTVGRAVFGMTVIEAEAEPGQTGEDWAVVTQDGDVLTVNVLSEDPADAFQVRNSARDILTVAAVVLTLYCWAVSFVRFREIEEKDAV